jgi:hypothetical protein
MFRVLRPAVLTAALAAAVLVTTPAHAQFGYGAYPAGYGGYGWGGWGGSSTVQGDFARGLGAYVAAEGTYNVNTAVADSINADTALRWNEYWYEAQVVANRNERLRLDRRMKRNAAASEQLYRQTIENPSPEDVGNGNALNAALDQVSNPRVHSSALRLMTDKIPGKVVREIPFVNASEAVTINLDKLTVEDGWPAGLRDPRFAEQRAAYRAAIGQALKDLEQGDIAPATVVQVRNSLAALRAKFEANRPADPAQYGESSGYLKSLVGMTRLLQRPDVSKIIAELETTKETTLGSLLAFMHTFNLRFGRATTPTQRAAYEQIYPLLDTQRDNIVKGLSSDDPKTTKADAALQANRPLPPAEFYAKMHLKHLDPSVDDSDKK